MSIKRMWILALVLILANLNDAAQIQFVLVNHSSSLWCPAEGGPALRIVWRKNDAVVQNSTCVRYRLNITEEEINTNYSYEVDGNGLSKKKDINLIVERCPKTCQCTVLEGNIEGLIRVDCERKQLRSIPCDIPRATVRLDLSENQFKTLQPDIFYPLWRLRGLWLENNNLKTLPEELFTGQDNLKYLRLVGNQLEKLPRYIFHGLTDLEELDLSHNQLQNLSRGVLSTNTKLKELDLSNNEIKHLPLDVFGNLTSLKKLFLSSNKIRRLPHFNNLSEIETLYIDNNRIANLSANQFHGLSKLRDLAIHDNDITHLPHGVFEGLKNMLSMSFHLNKIRNVSKEHFKDVAPTIRSLYFHHNRMRKLPEGFLSTMPNLTRATVDTNMMCCHLTKEDADCDYVYVDSFASCETMFRNRAARTCIWAIATMSLVGAIFVITWRMVYRETNIVQPIMLIHLAVSDGLMGIYLITIGWKDATWAGQYHLHDYNWRTSLACQITGAIAVLSSEVSLMLLSLISADRLKNIVFPFHVGGLTNKATHALCFIIWIIGFIIAFLPTIGIQYFRAPAGDDHFYGKNVVCLPLQLSNDKAPGWEYSVVVFVGLNLTFVAFVVLAYLAIVINRCQVQAMSANTQRETALAKRVFLIILTDCVCWMPIIVIGLRSIVEKSFSTSGDLAVWIAVFVLPLNSAINPILYTLSTTQVRDVLKAKWQQLCRYFVAKCGRTKNGEGGRHTGTVQTLAMRALNTAGGEEGPNKEALEEPEKEQAEVPKHEDPRVEHTEPQDKEPQDIKRKKPPKPGQPETEPFESNEQITAQPKKTRTEDHTKSQNDAAANSQYEQQHADFSGEEEQNQGLDDDNDRSEAQETAEAPQTKTDGELSETMMDTAL